jgi:hypothetical protein
MQLARDTYYVEEGTLFSGVDEASSILPISFEVMFQDCVESSMQYLNVVHWSLEQKAKL